MNTNWISDVLRLNSRIVTTQAMVSAQGDRILKMIEWREDTTSAEELHRAYGQRLVQLRTLQAKLLREPRGQV
jgi:hypothetical protein